MPTDHTETQPKPNISTEHQAEGDARQPSDMLDKDQPDNPRDTPGGNAQEAVEDRPNVSTVTPEDYPKDERAGGGVSKP